MSNQPAPAGIFDAPRVDQLPVGGFVSAGHGEFVVVPGHGVKVTLPVPRGRRGAAVEARWADDYHAAVAGRAARHEAVRALATTPASSAEVRAELARRVRAAQREQLSAQLALDAAHDDPRRVAQVEGLRHDLALAREHLAGAEAAQALAERQPAWRRSGSAWPTPRRRPTSRP